jgi:hypothetical protein
MVAAAYMPFGSLSKWIVLLTGIALLCPNSLQVMRLVDPALNWNSTPATKWHWVPAWQPSLAWALAISIVTVLGILKVAGPSEFLYWQF